LYRELLGEYTRLARFDRVSLSRYAVQFKPYLPQARFKTLALLRDFLKPSQ
jgi:hypothetical protein